MGISGTWAQRQRVSYTGALKWGNGIDPIHEIRDQGRGRQIGTRENLYPLGTPSDVVSPGLTSREIDWICDDYISEQYVDEVFRYQDDRPRWDKTPPDFRDRTNSAAMGEQPSWGVYYDDDPSDIWPRPGPTGGTQAWLDVSHGEDVERQRAIAVPTMPVTGGWLNKQRGAVALAESQDPAQEGYVFTINNTPVQGPGVKQMSNERAVARGTDDPRSPITSRVAGMAAKDYGRSFLMGGGPGTADMFPFQQTAGLKRPWFTRTAAAPPDELHQYNSMEGRIPITRQLPPDPYQGDPEYLGADDAPDGGWY